MKHRGPDNQLMIMESEEVEKPSEPELVADLEPVLTPVDEPDIPQISLQAMNGSPNYQIMRVKGLYQKIALQILLDRGSTHNFVDLNMAKKLGCKLDKIKPMSNRWWGHKLEAPFICMGFTWSMHNHEFTDDMIVPPLFAVTWYLEYNGSNHLVLSFGTLTNCRWSSLLLAKGLY